ncbi:prenyltransferase [Nocardioides flavus (ex Wang et al. 2016)]|uniref:Prenyltransferase n=1 Tax=Nocardioides flavus (ex Wang et al. 2016) TaxID=2058780 RepID=A0ABQ3HQ42_9ACTN|nr:prenyltransferase [Nocardioides flavus (ex Wang et al. 2016)]GHE18880.1 prenyltransferase [Nocardioides flavus (ex Wang et al. 2016)]
MSEVLTRAQVEQTAATIEAMQEPSGAIPWTPGEHTDVWNHLEAAMALMVGGRREAAERAFAWVRETQRADGSWPMKTVAGEVEDHSGETNMSAYVAVATWHHWLVARDEAFVRLMWPTVRRALDFVTSLQLPFGGVSWSQEWADGAPSVVNEQALLAGSSSIHHSLRAGVALAQLVGETQVEWELAGGRLGHALREHRDLFLDKSEFSMDWYYPVLGGAVRGDAARELLAERWDTFVEPGLGIRCVSTNPWVTGAETCELVLALEAIGDRDRARQLLADMQHLRTDEGSYWTGYVFPTDPDQQGGNWPAEQTTYTAAAVVLAVDALTDGTPGADIVRGTTLAADFAEIGLECGCTPFPASGERVAGLTGRTS